MHTPADLEHILAQSTHWNGYEREVAVRQLGQIAAPESIPELLVRANDWVPQVREAAYGALRRIMAAGHVDAVIGQLPAIDRLRHYRRVDHSALLNDIAQFLLQPDHAHRLIAIQ